MGTFVYRQILCVGALVFFVAGCGERCKGDPAQCEPDGGALDAGGPQPPVFTRVPRPSTVGTGTQVNLLVAARDPQHSELSFSWESNVGSVSVVETTPITSEVLFEVIGCVPHALTATATVTATNALGLSASVALPVGAPDCSTWVPTASLRLSRADHTATLLDSGQVLVVGGFSALAELYNPETATWTSVGTMAAERSSATATRLPSGKVLVAGGAHATVGSLASAEVYDPETREWSATGSLTTARTRHTATLLPSGKVLVVGGYTGRDQGPVASAELYDPGPGTWTSTGTLAMGRQGHTATLLPSGKVLVAGGRGAEWFLQTAEVYDPETGTWASTGTLVHERGDHSAMLLPSGTVLVAGGRGGLSLDSAELYDPETGTWADTGQLSQKRHFQPAVLLPSGKVLIAGGGVTHGEAPSPMPTAASEVYDPVSASWNRTGSLSIPRMSHTATMLPSGKVLVVGGRPFHSSAELFTP